LRRAAVRADGFLSFTFSYFLAMQVRRVLTEAT
jgi:hypothetical protein